MIFQFAKSTPRNKMSKRALIGIPSIVPSDIKRGKVYAMPKLMAKLKTTPNMALAQTTPQ